MRTLKKLKSTPKPDVKIVYDSLRRSGQKYDNAKTVWKRRLIQLYEENKKVKKVTDHKDQEINKKWTYYELSDHQYFSIGEYEQLALKADHRLP